MKKPQVYWMAKLHGAEFKVWRLNDATAADNIVTDTPETAAEYVRGKMSASPLFNPDVESLAAVFVNSRRRPIGFQILSTGTLDTILVHPREVFKTAVILNASAIILAHNHPSGDPTPSEGDIKITRDLIRAGQLMKIELLDHIVLGTATAERPKGWASLRELGYFYANA